ncbi:MAG: 4Fe-4S dicluster domain-containing protein [Desulfovibrio sp.]|jgi:heterodisulfide reductase subunit C|nr:4Fe-4S dicluster domain-containing protein [Desulfovibrio sp.]
METVLLNGRDDAFIRAVEESSGQVVSRCYQCGNCTAGCPMSFAYDYSVSQVMRLIQAGQKDAVLSSKAIWLCAACNTCSQRCPNEINVAGVMDACRQMARREKKFAVRAMRAFVDAFLDSVKFNGRSHEVGIMALYMLYTGRVWTDVELAPKVLPKGKMPLLPHRIKGRSEVAAIIDRYKQGLSDPELARARLAKDAGEESGKGKEAVS